MANTKFYKKDGNIILENVYLDGDKLSINPTNFDWKISNNDIYTVRDGIENQEYTLGKFDEVEDEAGTLYASDVAFQSILNTSVNITVISSGGGGGGDASASNQVLQITEAGSTNTKLDSLQTELGKKADLTETQPVNISKNQLGYDAWGRAKTIKDKSLFSGLFTENIPVQLWKEDFNGVERVPTNAVSLNGKLSITAGATLNDVTILETFRHLRYQANRGHLYSTAGYIVNPTGAMVRDFGTFTTESGVFFRVKSDGLYGVVATTYGGTYYEDERIIDTTGLDLSKGNTYDIQFEWRGVGNYFFYINLKPVLTINYIGTRTELTMFNPSNPCAFRSENLGDNDAMEFGCVDITSEGGEDPKGVYGSVSMDNESGQIAISGYNQPIIAIRSKVSYNGRHNTRDTLSLLASAYSDNKSFLRVWTTRDFTAITDGTQTWSDFGDGHLEYMIADPGAGTTMTFDEAKAQPPVFGCRVGQDDTYATSALFEGRTQVYQTPGDMLVFTMHRENGGSCNVGVSYEFSEEI